MESLPTQDARASHPRLGMTPTLLRAAALVGLSLAGVHLPAAEKPAPWRETPRFVSASDAIDAWLVQQPGGAGLAKRWADAVATTPRPARLTGPLLRVVATADGRLASLVATPDDAPPTWLTSLGDAEPSLRLAIADRLAGAERYDACLAWTEGLDAEQVYSPALLAYLRAVAWRMTVDDERATQSVERLATDETDSLGPARDWVVAAMERELETKSQPLPTVARRMRDVERRLSLAEPGETTQQRQQAILDELDELIKKLEEQRKQQQQMAASAAGGGGAEPGDPAEESRPSELKGPGEVDRKRLVAGDAWGSLPPAERERLTQAITRDFPPHYRGLIEDYFRTLAAEADAAGEAEETDADR